MTDVSRDRRPPQRARLATRRGAAVAVATAGLALLAAACGGSPSATGSGRTSTAGRSTISQQLLAFSRCLRSNGVPNWPDPNSDGSFPPSSKHIARSNPEFQAAQVACRHVLPNGGNGPTAAQWQQIRSGMVNFAACMRRHGMPNWPDPTNDPEHPGGFIFDIHGLDPNSPQLTAKMDECQYLLPSGVQGNGLPGWPGLADMLPRS